MKFLKKILGDDNSRALKKIKQYVEQINARESHYSSLTDSALKDKTIDFRQRLKQGESPDNLLPEAFAAVRESARRTLGERHFDVQLIGGAVLHQGAIAEMKTGEGKTLAATLSAYLNALPGRGVHIVTVNDYLARRDAVWMGQIYQALGLSVGCLNHEVSYLYDPGHIEQIQNSKIKSQNDNSPNTKVGLGTGQAKLKIEEKDRERDKLGGFKVVPEFLRPCSRREAYLADVTYGTNNEFGFDYLRDNLEYQPEKIRQRDFYYAIVDEVDSILIDEARTPLIISAPFSEAENLYRNFAALARQLKKGEDFLVDEKFKAVTLTENGIDQAERYLGVQNLYSEQGIKLVHHLENAVKAKALFERDVDYVIKDREIIIVDHFTGRLQPGRRWSGGLHQAIEAKEGLPIQQESRTFASITFQNYFRLYQKLSGMTGTALTSAEEFYKVYNLPVVAVPTNRPGQRLDHPDLIFQTEKGKFKAIARKIKTLQEKGQPVLVGTVSIEKNEILSQYLNQAGVKHEVLNAKNHEREGEIIAQAGRRGTVTVATNLAGRGVDIKLGGNPAPAAEYQKVKEAGGLFVLGTERHEARRIDNQLRGRAGRQGDPGGSQFFVSLEDSLMRVFAAETIKKLMGRFGIPEDEPIENRIISRALETAQAKIEGFNFDARKHVLEYDDVLNFQRAIVYGRRRKILTGDRAETEKFWSEMLTALPAERQALEAKRRELGEENFWPVFRSVVLQTIDLFWTDHLEMMDYLRSSVNLRAYGQREPLVEYKRDGLKLFKDMESALKNQVAQLVRRAALPEAAEPKMTADPGSADFANLNLKPPPARPIRGASETGSQPRGKVKIGRNEPCPCGAINPVTGQTYKYKKCGLINAPYHKK